MTHSTSPVQQSTKPLKILIVSTFFPPVNSIASHRPYSWAKTWSSLGHTVTVLTSAKQPPTSDATLPLPYTILEVPAPSFLQNLKSDYQLQKEDASINSSLFKRSLKKKLVNCFDFVRKKTGIFSSCRMPDFTDLWIKPAIKALDDKGPWDLVVTTFGPYAVHFIGASLKKNNQTKKWIADYRDRWIDSCIFPGLFPFTVIEKFVEKSLMSHADAITTVSEPFADVFAKKYKTKKIFTIENGVDSEDLKNIPDEPIFPQDGLMRIVHTGTIYERQQNPIPFFEAIAKMAKSPQLRPLLTKLKVIFVGPDTTYFATQIKKYQLSEWMETQGFVPRQDALRMQRDAHHVLFLPWNDQKNDGMHTGKLFEYLFSHTSIMAVGAQALEISQRVILEAQAGTILPNTDSIVAFLTEKLANSTKESMLSNQDYLRRYDRRYLATKLLEIGKQL